MVYLIDRALSSGDASGHGADVKLAELAVRCLSRVALEGPEGRKAVLAAKAVRRLLSVIRTDSNALEVLEATRWVLI
jgi:hypothetical protein